VNKPNLTINRSEPARLLCVMAKEPANGQTKTRLCPPLTGEMAARLYTGFLRDTLEIMRRVPGVRRTVAYWPQAGAAYFRRLAPDMQLTLQHGATLGERLDHLLSAALANGAQQVVVMDSDSPSLPATYVTEAFSHLDGAADVVLGPCRDGGYYLIGMKQPHPRLLREVQMSTPAVLRDTLALAASLGLNVALLPEWYDVDTAADLDELRAELAASSELAPHTAHCLRELLGEELATFRPTRLDELN
jgi:uncharacterized protein